MEFLANVVNAGIVLGGVAVVGMFFDYASRKYTATNIEIESATEPVIEPTIEIEPVIESVELIEPTIEIVDELETALETAPEISTEIDYAELLEQLSKLSLRELRKMNQGRVKGIRSMSKDELALKLTEVIALC